MLPEVGLVKPSRSWIVVVLPAPLGPSRPRISPRCAEKVRTALKRVQRERGVTMVYTSHNMREIELVCDRVIFLMHGRVVAKGTPREILERADSESLEKVFITLARGGRLEG